MEGNKKKQVSLSDLANATRKGVARVDTLQGPAEVEFVYRPNAFTPEYEQRTREERIGPDASAGDIYRVMLKELLVSIDLVGPEGKQVAINDAGLSLVPNRVMAEVMRVINEDSDPGKPSRNASESSFVER